MRNRFARNPYIVKKVKVVWEYDLLDVEAYDKLMIIIDTFFR